MCVRCVALFHELQGSKDTRTCRTIKNGILGSQKGLASKVVDSQGIPFLEKANELFG